MPSLAACLLALALAAPPKPVAHLRVATKDVKVWHGSTAVAAAKDLPLALADELDVPVGGFALVQIDRNEQLVRIDEDLRLAVRDLAALEAPKTSATLEAQVNALLTATEQQAKGSERMVGWYVAPAAAQVQTSSGLSKTADVDDQPLPSKAPSVPAAKEAPGVGRSGGGGKVAKPDERREESDEFGSRSRAVAKPAEMPAPTPAPAAMAPAPPPPPGSPPPLTMDDATRVCLRASLESLGASAFRRIGPTVTVKLRRGEGRVVVFLEGAVPVDACVQTWANLQHAKLGVSGWTVLEVPLK